MRDITLGETIDFKFVTAAPDTGAPVTLSGVPAISAYVGNSVTQITAGITLTVDFDTVTGLNNVNVVATSGNGYTDNTDVALVITTGTVDGNSAVGYVVAQFTIGRAAAYTRLGAPAGASVSADIAAIEAQTDDIGAAGAGLSAIPWNAAWDAEVQSEVADALAVYDPPTNAEMEARTLVAANYATAAALATVDGNVDAILVDTAEIGAAGAGLTALATAANLATVDTVVDNLNSGIITGAAATGTLSTTQATTDLTGYADDQLIGRVIIWLSGACEGEASDITDYASLNGLVTFTALTTAPANADTFKIV